MIYFAQIGESGPIKIGFSANKVDARLQWLSGDHGQKLTLLGTVPGDRSTEREIHSLFAHLRMGETEQFKLGSDLLAFIEKPTLAGVNPETIMEVKAKYGTVIRVSDEFGQALRDVTRFEKISVSEFADTHLLPIVRNRYRDAVLKEAKRMEGGSK
jgi:hypothetical protein